MDMDWKKQTSQEIPLYPEQFMKFRIDRFAKLQASTGTEQLRWNCTCVEEGDYEGKPFIEHTALTETSLWRLANFVNAAGVDTTQLDTMKIGSEAFYRVLNAVKGRLVTFDLYVDVYDGKKRSKVRGYYEVPGQDPVDVGESLEEVPDWVK